MNPSTVRARGSTHYAYLFLTVSVTVVVAFSGFGSSVLVRAQATQQATARLFQEWLLLRIRMAASSGMEAGPAGNENLHASIDRFESLISTTLRSHSFLAAERLDSTLNSMAQNAYQLWSHVRSALVGGARDPGAATATNVALDRFQHELQQLDRAVHAVVSTQQQALQVLIYCLAGTVVVTLAVFVVVEVEQGKARREAALVRQLAHRGFHAQEAERHRISRDLHDSLCQELTVVVIEHDEILAGSGVIPTEARAHLLRMRNQVQRAIDWARELSHELRPPTLDITSVADAISAYSDSVPFRGRLTCAIGIHAEPRAGEARVAVYRIAQEAITNAVRHAGADRIDVTIGGGAHTLRLAVQDNGCGMTAAARRSRGVGITGMRERARMLGADLAIESAPGNGTTVTLDFAVPDTEAS